MLFDSHCHLDFDAYQPDLESVVSEARRAGVTGWFVPGVAPGHWAEQWRRVGALQGVVCGFGVHPYWVHEVDARQPAKWMVRLRQFALERGALAIGECGLDALSAKRGGAPLDAQVEVLQPQLSLAKELGLPVVLHCVRAHGRLLEILGKLGGLPAGGVLHAYSGAPELVERYTELGFFFGFGGAVTRSNAKRARAAISRVPCERLLLETDAPDQAPEWCTGRNRPHELAGIARAIAQLRNCRLEDLARQTTDNARRLFAVTAKS